MKPFYIIDTDPGKDDVLAILYALLSEKIEVLAVTTVAGNTDINSVTNNAWFTLDMISSSVPLYSGAAQPLCIPLQIGNVMGEGGLEGVQVPKKQEPDGKAVSTILSLANTYAGQLSILAIGPLTNIALALRADSSLGSKIQRITCMGGTIEAPGNSNRVAEFNFATDPEAAKIVMESGIPLTLVPLDVCYQTLFSLRDFDAIREIPAFRSICAMLPSYVEFLTKDEGYEGVVAYDLLAAYAACNPTACSFTPMDIQIETKGEYTKGMCVVERRRRKTQQQNVSVLTGVKKEELIKEFVRALTNYARTAKAGSDKIR